MSYLVGTIIPFYHSNVTGHGWELIGRSVVRYLCSDLLYLSMFIAIPTYCYVVLVDLLNFSWLQLWEFAWFSDIANSDVMLILACSWSGIEATSSLVQNSERLFETLPEKFSSSFFFQFLSEKSAKFFTISFFVKR